MSEDEKRNTAYHEAGHAIVGRLMPEHDPVQGHHHPRGRALGVTMFLPEADRYSYNRTYIHGNLCSLYGGPRGRGDHLRAGKGHHRGLQRHQARHRDGSQHGDQVGPVGRTGPIAYGEQEDECSSGVP